MGLLTRRSDAPNEWGRRHPEFLEALRAGKSEANAEVAEAPFERPRGAKVPAVKIFMPPGSLEPVYAPFTEHLPSDTNAAVRWLMNRLGDPLEVGTVQTVHLDATLWC